ncbi:hypothetical protein G7Y89_g5547 [Cudoniella acicularis]|uniref:NAD-dependent epimerase/dehydratase domain-containing protein n=1 Tax=Cudoniella acicularis TaxID=354080 RepID=A0A8H4W5M0_9HELO|nr:hypothetical protein G7Y89_g5547 [Cudoniella acicularis]
MSTTSLKNPTYILVTGGTGFIGAHIVDALLKRGLRVRCATRSRVKGERLLAARPCYAGKLDVVVVEDFADIGDGEGKGLEDAVTGVDGVVHVASPFTYDTTDNEKELILPAINGARALFIACSLPESTVKRVVLTSSFAAILDLKRSSNAKTEGYFTYTAKDWNPLTYEEAAAKGTSAVVAYRGSKKFAELAAWEFISDKTKDGGNESGFDLVTICPPMTFGPVVHPVSRAEELNESNRMLWEVAMGKGELPVARVPFWVDVRDLAEAHVEALLRADIGGKRGWAAGRVAEGEQQAIDESYGLDGVTAEKELGVKKMEKEGK